MKYKVGDRVKYGSEICTVTKVLESQGKFKYRVQSDTWFDIVNEDEMIEGLVEEESANYSKVIDNGVSNPIIAKTSSATIDTDKGFYSYSDSDDNLEMEWNLPEGYIFKDENGNVINATKIVLEKKKREYPKTYDECCEVLGIGSYFEPEIRNATTEECHKFTKLIRLKRCRDAYWKLYGEEMGLEKPWEPDFEYDIYYIYYDTHKRIFSKDDCAYGINVNHFLVFPTEEMRDAFYENFKELIENCKELL